MLRFRAIKLPIKTNVIDRMAYIANDGVRPYNSGMADSPLKAEFQYFLENQKELLEKYSGKVIAIKDKTVIGVFDSEGEAVAKTQKDHKLGTFLVQKVEPGTSGYTQTFHSRVAFS